MTRQLIAPTSPAASALVPTAIGSPPVRTRTLKTDVTGNPKSAPVVRAERALALVAPNASATRAQMAKVATIPMASAFAAAKPSAAPATIAASGLTARADAGSVLRSLQKSTAASHYVTTVAAIGLFPASPPTVRRFFLGFITGVALILGLLVGLGHYLDVTDPLTKADAIVAISGDTGARAESAISLWKQGYAPLLIFSGGSSDPQSVASAELMKRAAIAAGVPETAIVVEGASATTEENAEKVALLMRGRGLRSAILVTSPYHQRRAALLFEREFAPASLSFRNHPAEDPEWDENLWWMSEPSRSRTLVELAKLGALVAGQRPG